MNAKTFYFLDNLLRGKGAAERHVFLFDNILVVTKSLKQSKGVSYKFKDQYDIRKADIVDIADEDGMFLNFITQ